MPTACSKPPWPNAGCFTHSLLLGREGNLQASARLGQCEGPVATVLAYVLWGQYQHEEHKLQLQAHSAGLASPGPRGKWGVTARSATLRQPSWDQHGRPPSPCEDGPVLCLMRCGHVWLWCTELNHEQSWLRWIRKADCIRGWVLTLHWSSARRYHRGKLREGGMGSLRIVPYNGTGLHCCPRLKP